MIYLFKINVKSTQNQNIVVFVIQTDMNAPSIGLKTQLKVVL